MSKAMMILVSSKKEVTRMFSQKEVSMMEIVELWMMIMIKASWTKKSKKQPMSKKLQTS